MAIRAMAAFSPCGMARIAIAGPRRAFLETSKDGRCRSLSVGVLHEQREAVAEAAQLR